SDGQGEVDCRQATWAVAIWIAASCAPSRVLLAWMSRMMRSDPTATAMRTLSAAAFGVDESSGFRYDQACVMLEPGIGAMSIGVAPSNGGASRSGMLKTCNGPESSVKREILILPSGTGKAAVVPAGDSLVK